MQAFQQDAVTDGRRLADLVRRIAAVSDRTAFAELFEVLAPRVRSFLIRLGSDGKRSRLNTAMPLIKSLWIGGTAVALSVQK